MARVATLCPEGTGPWAVTDSPGMAVPGRRAHWATTMLSAGLRRTVNCMFGPSIAERRPGAQRRFGGARRGRVGNGNGNGNGNDLGQFQPLVLVILPDDAAPHPV